MNQSWMPNKPLQATRETRAPEQWRQASTMKVHDNCPKPGRVWSIEVSSLIGRRKLARILSEVPGVRITKMPSYFSWRSNEPFCRFELGGRPFVVEAIWPSGNRFEISPEPPGCVDQLLDVREALAQHRLGSASGP